MAKLIRALPWVVCVAASLANANGCAGKKRPFADGTDSASVDPNMSSADDEQDNGLPSPTDPENAETGAGALDDQSSTTAVVIGPRLAVAPLELDLGSIVVELAAVRAVTVSNTGDRPLPVPAVSLLAGSAPEFTALQNGCLDALEPGESCAIYTQFLPTTPGDFVGAMEIDAGEGGTASLALSGRGLSPGDLLVSAGEGESAQFGNVVLGESANATLTVVNTGQTASGTINITINNPDVAVLDPIGTDCVSGVTELSPSASCTLRVAFTPVRRGPSEAILTVTGTTGSSGVRLDGVGSAPGTLVASPGVLEVRAVLGQPTPVTIAVQNRGDESVSILESRIESDTPEVDYTLVESACSGVLAGGASCQLVVEFKPNGLGSRSATLVVTPEAGDALTVPIAGEGLKPGALLVAPTDGAAPANGQPVDFGAIPRNQERVVAFSVTNPGAESSGFLDQISANGDFSVVAAAPGECGAATTLINGESCNLRVRFRPTQRGPRDGSLTVVSVGAGSVVVPLLGTGTLPADIAAVPANVQLGSAVLQETRTATVRVTNEGDEPATAPETIITGLGAAAFSVAGCASAIPALTGCDLSVQFRPTLDPAHTGLLTPSLQISSASGGTVNVSLTARGLRPGSLEVAPTSGASTAFQTSVNGSQSQVFGVTNTGGVDSGALSISVTNPPGPRNFDLVSSGLATACQTGQVLTAGSTCDIGVVFRPTQAGTGFAATLAAASASAGTDSIALTGVAQALASLSSPAAAASFPNGTSSPSFTWRIDNNGDVATLPLTLGTVPTGFSLGAGGDCPLNQAGGLPARSSCQVIVSFTSQLAPVQGSDQVQQGILTISAGQQSVSLAVTGTIPRALAGRGQVCVRDSDCQPGLYSFCGSSGSNELPNVCCDSPCTGNSCDGCTAGASGGTCGPQPLESDCVTDDTSRAGVCLQASTCTEYCIVEQSLVDGCVLD